MPAGRPSIGVALHRRVEDTLHNRPELGYANTAELVKDLLRRWLEAHEDGEDEDASMAFVAGETSQVTSTPVD